MKMQLQLQMRLEKKKKYSYLAVEEVIDSISHSFVVLTKRGRVVKLFRTASEANDFAANNAEFFAGARS